MFGILERRTKRGVNIVTLQVHDKDGNLKVERKVRNARVDTGAQSMCDQMFGAASSAPFNYVGLSTSTTAIVKTLTASTFTSGGEITAGGLARKQATYTYTTIPASLNANATATLTATWTATAGGTIGSIGALNASTAGILSLATVLGAVVTYAATDTISLTWTLLQ